ncbi:MAG: hypothetical protein IIU97_07105, partial [Bacteroidaceae bacterium]|nr:hypothetical protein [Bacteroidaceae bacterium]
YGQFGFCEPSCFIKEINPACIVMPNGGGVQQRQQQQPFRQGGLFGATNSGLGRRSAYNYGPEDGRPQFSRTGGAGAATAGRAAQQRSGSNGSANATGSAGGGVRSAYSSGDAAAGASTASRPANLYRVTDVQRFSQGAGGGAQPGVSVGAIVQHERFGIGEVLTTEGVGENAKATIKFQNAGMKTLLLKFAKLKIIG